MTTAPDDWLAAINWNDDGLIPAIAQDAGSARVLTLAWMNSEALQLTVAHGEAWYWSRTRRALWRKGETSGHVQKVEGVFLDCDNDAVVLRVRQTGGIACHTGRESCFYQQLIDGQWTSVEPVLKDPASIYPQATKE